METKQVIVLRKDLNMRKGKMVAQGAHASMKVFFDLMRHIGRSGKNDGTSYQLDITPEMENWMDGSFTKVCVGVNSEEELYAIYERAKSSGLPCSIITDAGKTEFNGVPTRTAVAIGPAEVEKVDAITGKLTLL